MADSREEAEPEQPTPEPGSLAKILKEEPQVLRRLLTGSEGYMTRWPSQKSIGVKSVRAMALNATILTKMAEWWCAAHGKKKPITIDVCRAEARSNSLFHVNFNINFCFPETCPPDDHAALQPGASQG